ncbi:unnamed protein product [Mytilus edulis]|uniref:B box-type domain-containing protein n=1 Tax=Mytilus edulis TaxID=6550 RepID=A0A8S3R7K6_MYTED|nr:unnamed protein product [Mytilus edulis]
MVAETHCDPCAFQRKTAYAISFCTECDENLCYECLKYHNAQWQNNDHTVTNFISIYRCTICKNMDKDVEAVTFCLECKEKLCKDCVNKHKSTKSSRGHTFDNSYLCQQSLDKSDISTQQPIIQDHVDFVEQHNEDNTEAIIQNECTDIDEPTRIDCGEIKTRPTTSLLQKCEKLVYHH